MSKPDLDLTHTLPASPDVQQQRRSAWTSVATRYAMGHHRGLAREVCRRHGIDAKAGVFPDGAIEAAAREFAEIVEQSEMVRELLAMLGFDDPAGPAREPGRCACGEALPVTATATGSDPRRVHGWCAGCLREQRKAARS